MNYSTRNRGMPVGNRMRIEKARRIRERARKAFLILGILAMAFAAPALIGAYSRNDALLFSSLWIAAALMLVAAGLAVGANWLYFNAEGDG